MTRHTYECIECGTQRRLMFGGYRKQAACTECGSAFNPIMTTWESTEDNRHDPDRVFNE